MTSFDFSGGFDDDVFNRPDSSVMVRRAPARPPLAILGAAYAIAVVGAALAWLVPGMAATIIGWVLAGPVAFGVLALFVNKDTSARATGIYSAPSWLNLAYWAGAGVAMIAVLLCALRIAEWVGRL